MKKFIVILFSLLIGIEVSAQTYKETKVKYIYPFEIGVGYSHCNLKNGFTSSFNGYSTSNSFGMMEWYCMGFYWAFGEDDVYTNNSVYGYTIRLSSGWSRFGFELGRLTWGSEYTGQSLSITPFYSWGSCGLSDCSGNTIGWSNYGLQEIENFRQKITTWGIKIDYSFSLLDIGLIVSPQELSVSINFLFPFWNYPFYWGLGF